jgi:chemotaxis protein methyltransferase CheR
MELHSFLFQFKAMIDQKLGMAFEENRTDQLLEILQSRLDEVKLQPLAYTKLLENSPDEWAHLATRLSVPETYFFRHPDQWQAFTEVALPARIEAQRMTRRLRILSAGCASGEEAFTAAIVLRERFPELAQWDVKIHGFDINGAMLQKAASGTYTPWSLRVTSPSLKQKYFTQSGSRFQLHEDIRAAASFSAANLMDFYQPAWDEKFDIVFFRNVLIYFSPVAAARAMEQIARVTAFGGFLFVGPAENLRGISQDYALCHTHESFYYQRRNKVSEQPAGTGLPPVWPELAGPEQTASDIPLSPASFFESTLWYNDILRSSQRVQTLTTKSTVGDENVGHDVRSQSKFAEVQRQILQLLAEDKFQEALALLPEDASGRADDKDALLVRAILLMNTRRMAEAQQICQLLLAKDEMNAGAHYLMAMCFEQGGDLKRATEHDEIATYLDPTFAMPYLHRAFLAKRAKNWLSARRLFDRALVLLNYEEASRLLLFGGGFHRVMLQDLCQRELKSLETAV